MNIGIIIFIISIIVTGISAMRDKSHEQRKIKDPSAKKSTSDKKKLMKKVFEQIEEAFSELEKEFTNEDKPSNKQKKDKQPNTKRVYQDQKLEKRNRKRERTRGIRAFCKTTW